MQRRMFSPEIVCSEEFLDMPPTSRELYFQLGMRADDDGFIQPKGVMRTINATNDDLKILLTKRFLLAFETGVVVVKHWLIHNMIRGDRYKPTRFIEEKKTLFIKDNKAYTETSDNAKPLLATKWQPNGNQMAPQVRLGKVSITADAALPIQEVTETNSKPPKVDKRLKEAYDRLIRWSEDQRGFPFLTTDRMKQYKAFKLARENKLKSEDIKDRWLEMAEDPFWQQAGFDWMNVITSFNKKPHGH